MSKRSKAQIESTNKLSAAVYINPFAWKHLSQEDITQLDSFSPEKLEIFFAQFLNLTDHEVDLKQSCVLEFYVAHYWWSAKERSFNSEQISTYFTIVHNLFNSLIDKDVKIHTIIDDFKNSLDQTSKVFDDDQLKDIITFLTRNLIENFRLYKYALNETQPEVILDKKIEVECPNQIIKPYPAPLDEAIPESIFKRHVLKISDDVDEKSKAIGSEEDEEKSREVDSLHLNEQVVEEIRNRFGDVSIDDVKRIIIEVTNEIVSDLKADIKSKIREQQSALLTELAKNQKK